MLRELNGKVKTATKWSLNTEVVVRLIVPLTSMVLARLLTPEAFGIVVTFIVHLDLQSRFGECNVSLLG